MVECLKVKHRMRQDDHCRTKVTPMPESPANSPLALALAQIPSGCCILTAAADSVATGMLASWVQQAAFEPPMVTVALKRGRPIETLIERSGKLTLNVIGEDPTRLFKHFGKGFALDQLAFTGLFTTSTPYGVELAESAGVLSGRVIQRVEAGDHSVYLVEIDAGHIPTPGRPYVHLRKSGFSY